MEEENLENELDQYKNDDETIDPRIEFEESDDLLDNLLISDSEMQDKIADILGERMNGYNPLK